MTGGLVKAGVVWFLLPGFLLLGFLPRAYGEWYVGGQVGGTLSPTFKDLKGVAGTGAQDNAGATLTDLKSGRGKLYGGKLGYCSEDVTWLCFETEVFRSSLRLRSQTFTVTNPGGTTTGTLADSSLHMTAWAFNVVARYPGQTFQPYLGLGVGLFTPSSDQSTSPGLNFLTGARLFLTDHVAVFAEWKYNRASVDVRDPTNGTRLFNGTYSAHNLVGSLTFHFPPSRPTGRTERASFTTRLTNSLQEGAEILLDDAGALATAPTRMTRQEAWAVAGATAAVGGLIAADRDIRQLALRNQHNTGREVANVFSSIGSPLSMAGVNAGAIALGLAQDTPNGPSRLTEAGLVGLEAEGFAVLGSLVLKYLTGRAAPNDNEGSTHFRPFSKVGNFPSTHAAASFAVAAVFADRFEAPVGWVAYGLATAVGLSRIYKNDHFASDVLAGSLIGLGVGKFISWRHASAPTTWRITPMAMDGGLGGGLQFSKAF